MTREERAKAYANAALRPLEDVKVVGLFVSDITEIAEQAYLQGAKDAEDNPAWRMCEDGLPTDPHQPYWVYAECCGECCVAYLQEKTNIFYDEGGEELSGVVAWLPLPKFNPKAKKVWKQHS